MTNPFSTNSMLSSNSPFQWMTNGYAGNPANLGQLNYGQLNSDALNTNPLNLGQLNSGQLNMDQNTSYADYINNMTNRIVQQAEQMPQYSYPTETNPYLDPAMLSALQAQNNGNTNGVNPTAAQQNAANDTSAPPPGPDPQTVKNMKDQAAKVKQQLQQESSKLNDLAQHAGPMSDIANGLANAIGTTDNDNSAWGWITKHVGLNKSQTKEATQQKMKSAMQDADALSQAANSGDVQAYNDAAKRLQASGVDQQVQTYASNQKAARNFFSSSLTMAASPFIYAFSTALCIEMGPAAPVAGAALTAAACAGLQTLLHTGDSMWGGYDYSWNDAGSDALQGGITGLTAGIMPGLGNMAEKGLVNLVGKTFAKDALSQTILEYGAQDAAREAVKTATNSALQDLLKTGVSKEAARVAANKVAQTAAQKVATGVAEDAMKTATNQVAQHAAQEAINVSASNVTQNLTQKEITGILNKAAANQAANITRQTWADQAVHWAPKLLFKAPLENVFIGIGGRASDPNGDGSYTQQNPWNTVSSMFNPGEMWGDATMPFTSPLGAGLNFAPELAGEGAKWGFSKIRGQ